MVPRSRRWPFGWPWTVLAIAALSAFEWGCAPTLHTPLERGFAKGVAIGFASADEALRRALTEMKRLGATNVSIVVPLYTESIHGEHVRRCALDDARGGDGADQHDARTPCVQTDGSDLEHVVAIARSEGLAPMIFPILRLRTRLPGEWRGKLDPPARDAWWDEYARAILDVAAHAHAADRLVIGSELVSLECDEERWRALARDVRRRFSGKLLYSANWDRYDAIGFWDAVDEAGISAYFSLAPRGTSPTIAELVRAWQPIVRSLAAFSARVARPIVFTEVGFPSVTGAAFWPWNDHLAKTACADGEGCEGATSIESQRRLWSAFVSVFSDRDATRFLDGTYVWLWAGRGGLRDRGYTPRGKPAQAIVKLWYTWGTVFPR